MILAGLGSRCTASGQGPQRRGGAPASRNPHLHPTSKRTRIQGGLWPRGAHEGNSNPGRHHPHRRVMHKARKRPSRPSDHLASAMPRPTKSIPAVSGQPTPADHPRQSPKFTSVQADLPGPRKAPPASRPSGPAAMPPNPRPAARQRTVRPARRRRRPPGPVAQRHRDPPGTARPAVRAASTFLAARQDPQALSALP